MAFNKAPSQSTYQTRDIKLISAINTRDTSFAKDVIPLNGFFDILKSKSTEDNEYQYVKRDGSVRYPFVPTGSEIRGIYFWEEKNRFYVAHDDKLSVCYAATGELITTITAFVTVSGDVGFTEFQYGNGTVKVVVSDGSKLFTIDDAQVTETSTSPDLPALFNPHVVYLDGYIFLIKKGTADIYNSNLDDPLAFTAGNFISAEMSPDELVRLVRSRNYIIALGTKSMETFYDAANPTASPLNRNDTFMQQIGYVSGLSTYGHKFYFIGQTDTTTPEVFVFDNFKVEPIDTTPIRRAIRSKNSLFGTVISMSGHDFYAVHTGDETFIVDLDTQVWTKLAWKNTTKFSLRFATSIFIQNLGHTTIFALADNMSLFYFNPAVFQDDGVNFTMVFQTSREMFDTFHEKYMSRLLVIADKPTADTLLTMKYTDDDYQTYSAERTVNLNQEFPAFQRLGRFRKRAFHLSYTDNLPMRLHHLEVDFNIGSR